MAAVGVSKLVAYAQALPEASLKQPELGFYLNEKQLEIK